MSSTPVIQSGESRRPRSARKWALGAIILVALAAVFVVPDLHRMYSRLLIRVCFSDVLGLQKGAEVRFAGVRVGHVRSVRARPDDKQCPADVEMAINPGYELRIPRDSTVAAETAGVFGATFLDIDAKDASGPPVQNHGMLKGRSVPGPSAEDMIKMMSRALDRYPCSEDTKAAPTEGKGTNQH